nr:MAG TPA: hypothetical protein [Caudoviricetes sp.]
MKWCRLRSAVVREVIPKPLFGRGFEPFDTLCPLDRGLVDVSYRYTAEALDERLVLHRMLCLFYAVPFLFFN